MPQGGKIDEVALRPPACLPPSARFFYGWFSPFGSPSLPFYAGQRPGGSGRSWADPSGGVKSPGTVGAWRWVPVSLQEMNLHAKNLPPPLKLSPISPLPCDIPLSPPSMVKSKDATSRLSGGAALYRLLKVWASLLLVLPLHCTHLPPPPRSGLLFSFLFFLFCSRPVGP